MYTSSIGNRGVFDYAFHPISAVAAGSNYFTSVIHESYIGTAFYSLKNLFISSDIVKEIRGIVQNPLSMKSPDPLVKAFNAKEFPQLRSDISKILNHMQPATLHRI